MDIFVILVIVLFLGHATAACVPENYLRLILKPRELQSAIRASRQIKSVAASRASADSMVRDHKKALEDVRKSRQKELEHFDYQLFEIERVPLMRSITDRSYSVIHQDTSLEEAKTFLTEIVGLSNEYTRFSSVDNLMDYRMVEDLNTLADIGGKVEQVVRLAEREKKQIKAARISSNDKAGVPYLATPVQVLDYIEVVKNDETSLFGQLFATKMFLDDEWDEIAYRVVDEQSMSTISAKVEAKLDRSIRVAGFEEEMHQEMLRRYEKSNNKEKLMEIWGVE